MRMSKRGNPDLHDAIKNQIWFLLLYILYKTTDIDDIYINSDFKLNYILQFYTISFN